MAVERPSVKRKAVVVRYVADRLSTELAPRGAAADLSRKIEFSAAAISNAKDGLKFGEDLGEALAGHWGMRSYAELVGVAETWAKEQASDAAAARNYPRRGEAAERARAMKMPEDFIQEVITDEAYNTGKFSQRPSKWWLDEMLATAKQGGWTPEYQKKREREAVEQKQQITADANEKRLRPAPVSKRRHDRAV